MQTELRKDSLFLVCLAHLLVNVIEMLRCSSMKSSSKI